jgi:hypothetical protein
MGIRRLDKLAPQVVMSYDMPMSKQICKFKFGCLSCPRPGNSSVYHRASFYQRCALFSLSSALSPCLVPAFCCLCVALCATFDRTSFLQAIHYSNILWRPLGSFEVFPVPLVDFGLSQKSKGRSGHNNLAEHSQNLCMKRCFRCELCEARNQRRISFGLARSLRLSSSYCMSGEISGDSAQSLSYSVTQTYMHTSLKA